MRIFFIALAVAALFPFCSKKTDKKDNIDSYAGTWELRSSSGMLGYKEYPSGNGHKMVINGDSLYEYVNNNLQQTRAFGIVKDTLRGFGQDRLADKLTPDIVAGFATFFERDGSSLTRYSGEPALDGGSSTYVRIK